ncbi:MAG TPA: PilZ domain-containing protein [Polyangiaceae bacterium]
MHHRESSPRTPRYIVRLPCQAVRERDFRLIADRLEDLSLTGLAVAPAEPVLTGEKLIVSFRLPHAEVWIDVEAYVSRVNHGRRPGESQRTLGLTFEQLDDSQRQAIALELKRAPPAPPGRTCRDESSERIARVLAWFSTRIEPSWQY